MQYGYNTKNQMPAMRWRNGIDGYRKIQLGQTGWILGYLPNLISGAIEAEIYVCKNCGKIEFYYTQAIEEEDVIAKVKCPKCGQMHDVDFPKCPFCKYSY